MEETSIVKEEMQEEIEMEMDEEMDEEIEEEENEEEELKEMEETTTVVPKITIVVDMSMQVMALKAKLGRRNTILEEIRRSYYRDVIVIKEEILKSLHDQNNSSLERLQSIPSADLSDTIPLYSPPDTFLRIKACFECGGTVEIVHAENSVLQLARENLLVSKKKEKIVTNEVHRLRKNIEDAEEITVALRQSVKALGKENTRNREAIKDYLQGEKEHKKIVLEFRNEKENSKRLYDDLIQTKKMLKELQPQFHTAVLECNALSRTQGELEKELADTSELLRSESKTKMLLKSELSTTSQTLSECTRDLILSSTSLETTTSLYNEEILLNTRMRTSLDEYKELSISLTSQLERVKETLEDKVEEEEAMQEKLLEKVSAAKKTCRELEKNISVQSESIVEKDTVLIQVQDELILLQNTSKDSAETSRKMEMDLRTIASSQRVEMEKLLHIQNDLYSRLYETLQNVDVLQDQVEATQDSLDYAVTIHSNLLRLVVNPPEELQTITQNVPRGPTREEKRIQRLEDSEVWNHARIQELEKEIDGLNFQVLRATAGGGGAGGGGGVNSNNRQKVTTELKIQLQTLRSTLEQEEKKSEALLHMLGGLQGTFNGHCAFAEHTKTFSLSEPTLTEADIQLELSVFSEKEQENEILCAETIRRAEIVLIRDYWNNQIKIMEKEIIRTFEEGMMLEKRLSNCSSSATKSDYQIKVLSSKFQVVCTSLEAAEEQHVEYKKQLKLKDKEIARKNTIAVACEERVTKMLLQRDIATTEKKRNDAQFQARRQEIMALQKDNIQLQDETIVSKQLTQRAEDDRDMVEKQLRDLKEAELHRLYSNTSIAVQVQPDTSCMGMQTDLWKPLSLELVQRNNKTSIRSHRHNNSPPLVQATLSTILSRPSTTNNSISTLHRLRPTTALLRPATCLPRDVRLPQLPYSQSWMTEE